MFVYIKTTTKNQSTDADNAHMNLRTKFYNTNCEKPVCSETLKVFNENAKVSKDLRIKFLKYVWTNTFTPITNKNIIGKLHLK